LGNFIFYLPEPAGHSKKHLVLSSKSTSDSLLMILKQHDKLIYLII